MGADYLGKPHRPHFVHISPCNIFDQNVQPGFFWEQAKIEWVDSIFCVLLDDRWNGELNFAETYSRSKLGEE